MAAALGTVPFCLGRWFSHLSVYQGFLEGLQSPILLDLSPQSVLGGTWRLPLLQVSEQYWEPPSRQWLHSQRRGFPLTAVHWTWGASGSGVAARAPNWSLKTRVLQCTCPLESCVTLGKPQHLSVPVAAQQARGCDEVGDCYSGCFCNSELVCDSCPEPSLPNWEARYSHSTPPPSIQVPTSLHNHSQLEWSTCLGVFFYSQPCMEPKGWNCCLPLRDPHLPLGGMCVLHVLFQTPFSTEIRIQNPRASLLPVNSDANDLLCYLGQVS